jgi:hypothetical protein
LHGSTKTIKISSPLIQNRRELLVKGNLQNLSEKNLTYSQGAANSFPAPSIRLMFALILTVYTLRLSARSALMFMRLWNKLKEIVGEKFR